MSSPLEVIQSIIPTICILYSFSSSSLSYWDRFQENFGNEEYFVALSFEMNPRRGYTPQVRVVPFEGTLSSIKREEPISGQLVQQGSEKWYVFESSVGRFVGYLRPSRKTGKCEPVLDFKLEKEGESKRGGTLVASFCY